MTRVVVDRATCMGSGNCTYRAPEVFDIDGEGLAVVIGDPGAVEPDHLRLAAHECPTRSIALLDHDDHADHRSDQP